MSLQQIYLGWAQIAALLIQVALLFWSIKVSARSTRVAERASQAAEESAMISRQSFNYANRPIIVMERLHASPILSKETGLPVHWQFSPVWKNVGNSGTKLAKTNTSWIAFRDGIPKGFDFPEILRPRNLPDPGPMKIFIHSQDKAPGAKIGVSATDITAACKDEFHVYVWGWIEYRGLHPAAELYRTEFSREIMFNGIPPIENADRFGSKHLDDFNGADEGSFCNPGDLPRIVRSETTLAMPSVW